MHHKIQTLLDFLNGVDAPAPQREALRSHALSLQKEMERLDFQNKRTLKDKSIMVNLLNTTIDELQLQKSQTEASNMELQAQKELIENQSRELAEHLRMLEKSYAELEQFSYIASHDLKSPLRTIASYAGLLRRRYAGQLDKEAIDFIEYIVKGASHMNEIIRDVLEYSGVNKSRDLELLDLNELVGLVRQNLAAEIVESQASICSEQLPMVFANRTGMMQLLQNLVANAIKFRGEALPIINISGSEQPNAWELVVSDNGVGLDESFQEKAFQPFQRINHLDRPGTGMGLAICHKIIKLHRGEIWFKSKGAGGTAFHFTIPKSLHTGEEFGAI